MQAFHNDPKIKEFYLARVREHRAADQIIQGLYWQSHHGTYKGCAVGCTIHGSEHRRYEVELGIPEDLAMIQDHLFEALAPEDAIAFPEAFLEAIPVGKDLTHDFDRLCLSLLADPDHGVRARTEGDKEPFDPASFDRFVMLMRRRIAGETIEQEEWGVLENNLRELETKYADWLATSLGWNGGLISDDLNALCILTTFTIEEMVEQLCTVLATTDEPTFITVPLKG